MAYENGAEPTPDAESNLPAPPPATGLIELYLEYTKDLPSPEIFRRWTAIHAVGAAVERRVWTQLKTNRLHPNLFIFLVGPPGTGKSQAINPMTAMLRKSMAVGIAPDDMTKQGLLDGLKENAKGAMFRGKPFDYHYMSLCVSELSNFMSEYDKALAGILTHLFDCPDFNEEKKRSGAGEYIDFPGISILAGTATKNLGDTISDAMWGSGFMARVIMVYSAESIIPPDMFSEVPANETLRDSITAALRTLGTMCGPCDWSPEARELIQSFRVNQKDGAPLHNRLEDYVTRRWLHLAKLCMISALSNGYAGAAPPTVAERDFVQAYDWLCEAEAMMTEIFKDMLSHEDGRIYEQMRSELWAMYTYSGKRALHASIVYRWIGARVASHSVQRILDIALAGDYLRRVAGTEGNDALYVPQLGANDPKANAGLL